MRNIAYHVGLWYSDYLSIESNLGWMTSNGYHVTWSTCSSRRAVRVSVPTGPRSMGFGSDININIRNIFNSRVMIAPAQKHRSGRSHYLPCTVQFGEASIAVSSVENDLEHFDDHRVSLPRHRHKAQPYRGPRGFRTFSCPDLAERPRGSERL